MADNENSLTEERKIKCLVWDLDNTLWDGILLEDADVILRQGVVDIIKTLDSRGILLLISSKNDYDMVMKKLEEFQLREFFIYPQINWNSKSASIKTIAQKLNLGLNSFAFIDDQQFELDEVKFSIPEVRCIDAADLQKLSDMSCFIPRFITEESKNRRFLYLNDAKRKAIEENFEGTQQEFLASLR